MECEEIITGDSNGVYVANKNKNSKKNLVKGTISVANTTVSDANANIVSTYVISKIVHHSKIS